MRFFFLLSSLVCFPSSAVAAEAASVINFTKNLISRGHAGTDQFPGMFVQKGYVSFQGVVGHAKVSARVHRFFLMKDGMPERIVSASFDPAAPMLSTCPSGLTVQRSVLLRGEGNISTTLTCKGTVNGRYVVRSLSIMVNGHEVSNAYSPASMTTRELQLFETTTVNGSVEKSEVLHFGF